MKRGQSKEVKVFALKESSYKEPSGKDVKMAKAYGGIARGPKQKIMGKASNSNRMLTANS